MKNQFTNEQIGAGAKALFDRDNPGREHALLAYEEVRGEYEAEARAALEAAAIERVTAERDSAMARIAKAWELHEPFIWSFGHGPVQSCKWCADHGVSQEVASWPCPTAAALDGAPEPEAGTKVVIGKQNRGDDDESWTFTEWEPFELEKAREEFPNSVYEVVTVFGLPVEGERE